MNDALSVFDISGSGLAAQRLRMGVIAANIANANTMETPEGGPYRRRDVVFAAELQNALDASADAAGGVTVKSVTVSNEPFKTVFDPDNPLADEKGFVKLPNIEVMTEMVKMVAAQRGYDANLSALKTYRDMLRNAISIIRA